MSVSSVNSNFFCGSIGELFGDGLVLHLMEAMGLATDIGKAIIVAW